MTDAPATPWHIAIEPDPVRPEAHELIETPDLDRLTDALADPGSELVLYRVTYRRVGRRGGRNGSAPPPALTVWAMNADDLALQVHRDVRQYLGSHFFEVLVDLEQMRGSIVTSSLAGSFTVERIAEAPGESSDTTSQEH